MVDSANFQLVISFSRPRRQRASDEILKTLWWAVKKNNILLLMCCFTHQGNAISMSKHGFYSVVHTKVVEGFRYYWRVFIVTFK